MSLGKTTRSNYIYINSETHSDGLGRVNVSLASEQFRISPGELQRLTLQTFEMPLYFHTINRSNKWFFWYSPLANAITPIEIPEGTYATFDTLGGAISAGLADVFDQPDVTYDAVQRSFTIEPGAFMADQATPIDPDGYFISYYASAFPIPNGITQEQFHQNTHEILGCIPSTTREVNAFGDTGTSISYSCYNVQTKQSVTPKSSINDALIHTFWLNGMSDEDVKVYTENCGEQCICYICPEGEAHLLDETEARVVVNEMAIPKEKDTSKDVKPNA